MMVGVSGREEGIAAGVLFPIVSLPFIIAGYYLAKEREDIKWVKDMLAIIGLYPFAYAVRAPMSLLLAGLIILIIVLSTRDYEPDNEQVNAVFFRSFPLSVPRRTKYDFHDRGINDSLFGILCIPEKIGTPVHNIIYNPVGVRKFSS